MPPSRCRRAEWPSPASAGSGPWPFASSPTRSPAGTRARLAGPRRGARCPPHARGVRTSARRTTFNAFYTSPTVIAAMHEALDRLGVPDDATVLEPGCGTGNFLRLAPEGMRFIGVELDSLSGRIARALHPGHDIRIENFRDTKLPEGSIDAVIGNLPFADVKLDYRGQKLLAARLLLRQVARRPEARRHPGPGHEPLHARQAERRRPRVPGRRRPTSSGRSACRPTPSSARARRSSPTSCSCGSGRPASRHGHADPSWLEVAPLAIEGVEVPINRYFLNHPEMVLGHLEPQGHALRRRAGLQRRRRPATWTDSSPAAVGRLPGARAQRRRPRPGRDRPRRSRRRRSSGTSPRAASSSATTGSSARSSTGRPCPSTYGGTLLKADGTMTGKRLAALIGLRDRARRVLQSQNEGWPEAHRDEARRELEPGLRPCSSSSYGPINKTTFSRDRRRRRSSAACRTW